MAPPKRKMAKPPLEIAPVPPELIGPLWARLEAWFAARFPRLSLRLRRAATGAQIAEAEETLGISLPADFRASLLVHDGQDDDPEVMLLPRAERLGSLAALLQCWRDDRTSYDEKEVEPRLGWLSSDDRVRQVHLHPKQVPFAGGSCWDYGRLLFDFIPGPNGASGQIIARDDIELRFVCTSFGELLEKTVTGLELGTITVEAVDDQVRHELTYRSRTRKPISPYKYFASSFGGGRARDTA